MKKLLILIASFILAPAFVNAAVPTLEFSGLPDQVSLDEEFLLEVYVDTLGEQINGIALEIFLSENLEVVDINENRSIVPLWIKRPEVTKDSIKLAGIIPGGFSEVINPGLGQTTKGNIVSIIIKPVKAGTGMVTLTNQSITLHDGSGTELISSHKSVSVNIENISRPKTLSVTDETKPEHFFPELVRDQNIFDGDLTLFFETRDFESGIARYEIREDKGEFVIAESPYRLRGQEKVATITVRAIDRAGNDRTVELVTGFSKNRLLLWPLVLVLIMILATLLLVHRRNRS